MWGENNDNLVELVEGNPHPGSLPQKTILGGTRSYVEVQDGFCFTWACKIGSELDHFMHL